LNSLKTSLIAASILSAAVAQAGTITCNDNYRTATLSNATSCFSQTLGSTAKASDLKTITGSSWSMVDALTSNGTDGWFTITGTGWGTGSATGTWSISDLFWDNFASAMITMHVGGGQKGAVDNFEWLITPESTSGIFSYLKTAGKGGGLSNFKLWGMGTPVKTEPTPAPAPAPATPAPADPAPATPAPADPAPAAPAPANPAPAADPAPATPAPADPQPAAPAPADPQPAAPAADPVPSEPTPAPTPLPPNPGPVVTEPEPNPVPPPVFEPETPLPPTIEPTVPAPTHSVPEPTPWMLMLLGAMVITLLRRHPAKR